MPGQEIATLTWEVTTGKQLRLRFIVLIITDLPNLYANIMEETQHRIQVKRGISYRLFQVSLAYVLQPQPPSPPPASVTEQKGGRGVGTLFSHSLTKPLPGAKDSHPQPSLPTMNASWAACYRTSVFNPPTFYPSYLP